MPRYGARPPKHRDVFSPDPVKCVVPRCKNMAERKTPEGDPVCRTHLARRNMFGAVDAESPTIKSVGRGNEDKKGFSYVSPNTETIIGAIEFFRKDKLDDKFKNAYVDFKTESEKDRGGSPQTP